MIDYKKLSEDLTPLDVCKYLGIKTRRSGKNIFLRCPAHEKIIGRTDKNISNCILGNSFRFAFKCFSCGASGSVIDLIAYESNLDQKRDFREILSIAAKATGHESDYIIPESSEERQKYEEKRKQLQRAKEIRILSDEDFHSLGLDARMFDAQIISECIGKELMPENDTENYRRYTHFANKDGEIIESTVYLKTEKKTFDIKGGEKFYKKALLEIADKRLYKVKTLLKMSDNEICEHFKVDIDPDELSIVREQLRLKAIQIDSIKRKLESPA